MRKLTLIFTLLIALSSSCYPAIFGKITGLVRSAATGTEIQGATVSLEDTTAMASTDFMGRYYIIDLTPGKYKVRASAAGFREQVKTVEILKGQTSFLNFELENAERLSNTITSIANNDTKPSPNSNVINNEKNSPYAYSIDLPQALDMIPGVFVSDRGSHSAFSEMYYRGLNRMAVTVDGMSKDNCFSSFYFLQNVPGLMAMASEAEIQPGAGSVINTGLPSTGVVNIITKAPDAKPGAGLSQFYGNGNTFNTIVTGSTGSIGGFSLQTALFNSNSDGIIDRLWSNSLSYYMGMIYDINSSHQVEMYLLGTYKRHANRDETESIEYWDSAYARDNGVSLMQGGLFTNGINKGTDYNPQAGSISYPTREYYWGKTSDRKNSDFLNESETYSHTPQAALNWNWKMSDMFTLSNQFDFLLNTGGVSTMSRILFWADSTKDPITSYDDIYEYNSSTDRIDPSQPNLGKESKIVILNIAQNDNKYGWKSVLTGCFSQYLSAFAYLNYNHTSIERFQEIRNLIGGDYMTDGSNYLGIPVHVRRLGEKTGYYYEGSVNEFAGGAGGRFSSDGLTVGLLMGVGVFNYTKENLLDNITDKNEKSGLSSMKISGSVNYKVTEVISVYAAGCYQSSPPQYDAYFNRNNTVNEKLSNESAYNIDLGAEYKISYFRAYLNFYYNIMRDYSQVEYAYSYFGTYRYTYLDLDSRRYGVEAKLEYKPNELLEFQLSAAIAHSEWFEDAVCRTEHVRDYNSMFVTVFPDTLGLDIDGIITGGAPRKSFSFMGIVHPWQKSYISLSLHYYADNYSKLNPYSFSKYNSNKKSNTWKIPNYFMLNLHAGLDLPFTDFMEMKLYGNVYNLLNTKYISLSYDGMTHNAESAQVLFGMPISWNLGLMIGL